MMIDPPIDKLIQKTWCRYALVTGIAKRAKELSNQNPEQLEESGLKPISLAAKEIYDGEIIIAKDIR